MLAKEEQEECEDQFDIISCNITVEMLQNDLEMNQDNCSLIKKLIKEETMKVTMPAVNKTEGITIRLCLKEGHIVAYFSKNVEEPTAANHDAFIEVGKNSTTSKSSNVTDICKEVYMNLSKDATT